MKVCSKCNVEKHLKEFYTFTGMKDDKYPSCKACNKKLRLERKDQIKQYRDDTKVSTKLYQNKHRDRIRAQHTKRHLERLKDDPNYKLTCILRSRIIGALRKHQKAGSAVKDLGCSIDCLKFWLEVQFYDNTKTGEKMCWNNHTKFGWHIDHIKPLASFDLEDREQFLQACHFSNLRPLWWFDNLCRRYKEINF